MSRRTFTVYGLVDPRQPRQIRFIGLTVNCKKTERQHRGHYHWFANPGNVFLECWKRELRSAGRFPLLLSLEVHRRSTFGRAGKAWWIENTPNLLNTKHGGGWQGGMKHLGLACVPTHRIGA